MSPVLCCVLLDCLFVHCICCLLSCVLLNCMFVCIWCLLSCVQLDCLFIWICCLLPCVPMDCCLSVYVVSCLVSCETVYLSVYASPVLCHAGLFVCKCCLMSCVLLDYSHVCIYCLLSCVLLDCLSVYDDFVYSGAQLWNRLNLTICSKPSCDSFKSTYVQHHFNNCVFNQSLLGPPAF